MCNDLKIAGPSVERAIPELCNYLHIASFLGLALVCFTQTYTGRSRLSPINLSPILNQTAAGRHLQTAIWQTASDRWCLADGVWQTGASGRRHLDGVCRRCLPDGRLADATRQPSGRRCLTVCQTAVWQPDVVCQTASARQAASDVWQTADITRRRLTDGVWQTTASGRPRLADGVC